MDFSVVNTEVVLWIIDTLLVLVGSLIMWNVRRISADIKDADEAIRELRNSLTDVKVNYVHKDELRDIKDELGRRFDRLENLFLQGRRHEG